jgi:nitroimidazol reductase NimA-like FMN-containing flavoprotein (pyridoxamine 5'-phosphate oxidase superfamily)
VGGFLKLGAVRRKDREIKNFNKIENILRRASVCHLGTYGDGYPYVTPFNYFYAKGVIAIHLSAEGKAFCNLLNHKKVCIEALESGKIIKADSACKTSMEYRSIIAFGEAKIVEERKAKKMWLQRMLDKYRPDRKYSPMQDQDVDKVSVAVIRLKRVTGKERDVGTVSM